RTHCHRTGCPCDRCTRAAIECASQFGSGCRLGRVRQRTNPPSGGAAASIGVAPSRLDMTADLTAFVDAAKLTGFFDDGAVAVVARAPGRLDVMGGIADYSGSLV